VPACWWTAGRITPLNEEPFLLAIILFAELLSSLSVQHGSRIYLFAVGCVACLKTARAGPRWPWLARRAPASPPERAPAPHLPAALLGAGPAARSYRCANGHAGRPALVEHQAAEISESDAAQLLIRPTGFVSVFPRSCCCLSRCSFPRKVGICAGPCTNTYRRVPEGQGLLCMS